MNMPTFKPTKADPSNLFTVSAFSWLASNTDVRARYQRTMNENIARYGAPDGWPYRWTSGVINNEWPDSVQNQMREYCRLMVEMEDKAYECWRKAGRRRATLRVFVEASREVPEPIAWDISFNAKAQYSNL